MVVWLRRLGWCVVAVLALWVVTWLALPPLIQWQVPLRASEALGRAVTIGHVGFKPWSLELTFDDFAIAGPTGPAGPAGAASEPLLHVKRLRADLSLSSIVRRAPVIEALEIDTPKLRLARTGEGHYDVDDLIARFTPRADSPPSEPARFALYNLQVRDAALRFDDQPVKRVQQVDSIQLALPFLSNLPAQVEVTVEPRLAFRLNGTPFDSGAQATPFAQTRAGDLKLKMADLDLAPYLGYLPASLPVRLTRGSVSADLALQFSLPPGGAPRVVLKGSVGAKGLALTDPPGQPLLALRGVQLALRDVQPLARQLGFESLRVDGLQLNATRDAAGRINLLALAGANAAPRAADSPVPAPAASAASGASTAPRAATEWQVGLDAFELADARVLWNDAAVKPAAALQVDGLGVRATSIRWPVSGPIAVSISGAIRSQDTGAPALAEFAAEGPVTDHDAKLALTLKSLSLGAFAPYAAEVLVPSVTGQLAAQAKLDWSGAADAPRLQLTLDNATLDALSVRDGKGRNAAEALSLKQLALGDVKVDLLAATVSLGSVKIVQPSVTLARETDGRLNLQRWAVAGAEPKASRPASPPAPAAAASSPVWRVQLKDLLLEGGQVRFTDALARHGAAVDAEPVQVALTSLRIGVQGLEWQGERKTAPAAVQLSARVGGVQRDKTPPNGAIDYKGRVGIEPLLANGNLRVTRFPVHLFSPYLADQVQLTLLHAEAGYTGSVAVRQLPAGLDVNAAGDVLLGGVQVATLPDSAARATESNTDELLSWQSLALKRVKVSIKPKAKPQVEIGESELSDFYSRLVITDQGRFNLQDVAGPPPGAASAPPATLLPPAPATAQSSAAVAAEPAARTADAGLPLDLKLGPTILRNGRVDFTDRFVRPNYSAALTELNGQLGPFSSGSRDMATLELRGRAAGTALLEIGGQLNPTAKPLALDIHAKATDLELAPLSPYAGKYAGYTIERGKLSMDIAYKIDADGKLDAKNQVVLNQLTFGDKIESKDATKLPVLLAVALLKDRNGVIDINLPVSGSINDPKFSVGGIIWKVILNLLTKALTAPFALLSGGGGEDLSLVEFQPGTALVSSGGAGAIEKVAKALTERPSLKMTVTGSADPAAEREAFQRAALENRLLAERRREALRSGAAAAPAGEAASAPPALGADERARLLKQVYKDTDIPNKPRNLIGFAKDIPPAEMEALLKTRLPAGDDAMRELALQRGLAVRDALIARGLPSERLFLAAPKLRASGEGDANWTPRVQLALTAN